MDAPLPLAAGVVLMRHARYPAPAPAVASTSAASIARNSRGAGVMPVPSDHLARPTFYRQAGRSDVGG